VATAALRFLILPVDPAGQYHGARTAEPRQPAAASDAQTPAPGAANGRPATTLSHYNISGGAPTSPAWQFPRLDTRGDRLRGWGGRIRTSMCREKIHLIEMSRQFGFRRSGGDGDGPEGE
jgi:hypothetical protein